MTKRSLPGPRGGGTTIWHHGHHPDWCHLCGLRKSNTVDVWRPENAEQIRQGGRPAPPPPAGDYFRICADCAGEIAVCGNDPGAENDTPYAGRAAAVDDPVLVAMCRAVSRSPHLPDPWLVLADRLARAGHWAAVHAGHALDAVLRMRERYRPEAEAAFRPHGGFSYMFAGRPRLLVTLHLHDGRGCPEVVQAESAKGGLRFYLPYPGGAVSVRAAGLRRVICQWRTAVPPETREEDDDQAADWRGWWERDPEPAPGAV